MCKAEVAPIKRAHNATTLNGDLRKKGTEIKSDEKSEGFYEIKG